MAEKPERTHLKEMADELRDENLTGYPGDDAMMELVEAHSGNFRAIARALGVSETTVHVWIGNSDNSDVLKELADELRLTYPGDERLKEVIELTMGDMAAIAEEFGVSRSGVYAWFRKKPERQYLKDLADDLSGRSDRQLAASEKESRRIGLYPGECSS